jgi:Peptidase M16C associated
MLMLNAVTSWIALHMLPCVFRLCMDQICSAHSSLCGACHFVLTELEQETPDPPEALNCIPSLQLADIPKEIAAVPTDIGTEHVRRGHCMQCGLLTSLIARAQVAVHSSFESAGA